MTSASSTRSGRRWKWGRRIGAVVLLLVVGGATSDAANDRAQQRWLVRFGADPAAPPQDFFARRVHVGMNRAQVTGVMPEPTRIDRYIVRLAAGDSTLLERYIYRLTTSDWPVDVYYDRRGEVFDFYTSDNPGLGPGPRRITPEVAAAWGQPDW